VPVLQILFNFFSSFRLVSSWLVRSLVRSLAYSVLVPDFLTAFTHTHTHTHGLTHTHTHFIYTLPTLF